MAATGSACAGPTVVVDQQHCSSAQPEGTPRRSLLAYPRRNNFLLFDGRLGHGVLDTLSGDLRMTLLVNWWHHKPLVRRTAWLQTFPHARCQCYVEVLRLLVSTSRNYMGELNGARRGEGWSLLTRLRCSLISASRWYSYISLSASTVIRMSDKPRIKRLNKCHDDVTKVDLALQGVYMIAVFFHLL